VIGGPRWLLDLDLHRDDLLLLKKTKAKKNVDLQGWPCEQRRSFWGERSVETRAVAGSQNLEL